MARPDPRISLNSTLLNVRRDELEQKLGLTLSKAAQVEAQLAVLTAEHIQLLKEASFYQAALAPWKQVPNEVLQRIFVLSKSDETPKCVPFSRKVAPMQLLQVCSRWREVAIATPTIWQDLKWVYLPPKLYNQQEVFAFLQTWVSRASYAPLSIVAMPAADTELEEFNSNGFMNVSGPQWPMMMPHHMRKMYRIRTVPECEASQWELTGGEFNLINHIILPNSSRIRNLHITFPEDMASQIISLLKKDAEFPLLEGITIGCTTPIVESSDVTPSYTLLKNAPRLEALNLKLWLPNFMNPNQLPGKWSHITHFEVETIQSPVFFRMLDKMKTLQSCKASIQWMTQPMPAILTPNPTAGMNIVQLGAPWYFTSISLPFLRTLDLKCPFRGGQTFIGPLETCNFPSLEELALTSEAWDVFASSFLKSTTSLRQLRLQVSAPLRRDKITAVLSIPALSDLTSLSVRLDPVHYPGIRFAPGGDTIDQNTIKAIAAGRLIPHLHTFRFEGKMANKILVHLLVHKGFISPHDGSTIMPDLGEPVKKSKSKSKGSQVHNADPFQVVKITGCQPEVMNDPDLTSIEEQVGEECFAREEQPPLNNHGLMHQLGWM